MLGRCFCLIVLLCLLPTSARSQQMVPSMSNFPPEEFAARRAKVFDRIGSGAFALIQGAPAPIGLVRFRQSNQFYYLSGIAVPNAYLLLDGFRRRTLLYLPHRNEQRERGEGKVLSAEDAELVKQLTGVDRVYGTDLLAERLARLGHNVAENTSNWPVLYTPFSPAEGRSVARSSALSRFADNVSNPWDGQPSREGHFVYLLRTRFPQFEVRDLSLILGELRVIKSPREISLIRRATELAGLAIMEAMRSSEPGLMEYELDAVGKFIFYRNGAQGEGYHSIVASGSNAYFYHYHAGKDRMQEGDLVLMDYCPDFAYYVCDVTRMFPVNGKFNEWQRELYGFYLACYKAIIKHIRLGVPAQVIEQEVAREWQEILAKSKFSKPAYEEAAQRFASRFFLDHWVGMAVSDPGPYRPEEPLKPGMVFTIEPVLQVPEERIYIRLEDVILVTETGAESLSSFIPVEIDEIENLMREEGILQKYPRAPEEISKQ